MKLATKLRVGLISPTAEDAPSLRKQYPDLYVTHGKNIVEFSRVAGSHKYDAILFLDSPELKKEFNTFLNFIRGKKDFTKTPIAILSPTPFQSAKVFADPSVRTFANQKDLFLPLLNFFEAISKPGAFEFLLGEDKIVEQFTLALGQKLGKHTIFKSRAANKDESYESYICQNADEISCNLLWIKFSARVLEKGSEGLKKMLSSSEDELTAYIEKLLTMTFDEFRQDLVFLMKDAGAIYFPHSDELDGLDRAPYLKKGKSSPLIFESSVCTILLDTIRYI